jgi:hypothetical protein
MSLPALDGYGSVPAMKKLFSTLFVLLLPTLVVL